MLHGQKRAPRMPSGRFWVLLGSASGMNRSACAPGTSLGICVAVPSRISQSSRNCSCQNQPDLSPCFCEQQDSRASDCRPGHNCCRESCVCSASVFDDPESSMLLFDFGLRFWSAFLNSRTCEDCEMRLGTATQMPREVPDAHALRFMPLVLPSNTQKRPLGM